jgi:ATP-dependent phosphofructokinase / diphosphate-dependent phosphofructokinase
MSSGRVANVRVGILTGGGDCPGLNAAIRAAVRYADGERGLTVIGFRDGWRGVMEGRAEELTIADVRGILARGGTILGTSGSQPHRVDGGVDRVREAIKVHRLDGLVVLGGEGTLGAAAEMGDVPTIGIPKTIDNDLRGTDVTIGFHTASQIATDLVDRLYSTAESHNRVMVCEVMGRQAGWIALTAGIAAGADVIVIPEHPFDVDLVCRRLREVHTLRRQFSILVVAEGASPVPGSMDVPEYPLDPNGFPMLGGIASVLAAEIARRTGYETRVTVLGHVQRGGSPVAYDRVLATRLARAAVDGALAGRWGAMAGMRGGEVAFTPLAVVGEGARTVPEELWRIPEVLCD